MSVESPHSTQGRAQRLMRTLIGPLPLAVTMIGALGSLMPWLGFSSYAQTLAYYTAYFLALGQAWNLMSGMTGYVSFCHGALAAIGSYAAVLTINADWPLIAGLAAGSLAAGLASLLIGATSLRLRGTSFTFATLFFQALMLLAVRKLPSIGGAGGIVLQEIFPAWLPHVAMMATAVVSTIVIAVLRQARTGIRLLAIKGDEDAAAAAGIDTTSMKITLFFASASLAGLVGAVHAVFAASLYPDVVFSVTVSLNALAVPLIGGVGTAAGPIVGAALYVIIREVLQIIAPGLHLVIVGLLILAVVLFFRDGLAPAAMRGIRSLLSSDRRSS